MREIEKESKMSSPPPLPLQTGTGYENRANICYLNAVLQCFTHTVPFVERILAIFPDHRILCHHQRDLHCFTHTVPFVERICAIFSSCQRQRGEMSFCSICALHRLIKKSYLGSVVSTDDFSKNVSALCPTFKSSNQEDAHEFLIGLLENLKSRGSLNGASEDLVAPIFEGSLNHQMRCCSCGNVSATSESMHGLSLAIDKSESLLDALKFYMIVERLEGLTCDKCKMIVAKEKWYTFDQAPLVVFFHLKRFSTESNDTQKIDKFVEFPLELNLQPFHGGTRENKVKATEEMLYNLYVVVVHIGSCGPGHYISYVRLSPNRWCQFNDAKVSEVSKDEVLKKEAYIVFYTRESVSGAKLSGDNTEADFEGPVWDTYPPSPKMSDSGQSSGWIGREIGFRSIFALCSVIKKSVECSG